MWGENGLWCWQRIHRKFYCVCSLILAKGKNASLSKFLSGIFFLSQFDSQSNQIPEELSEIH